ncbi:ATP-dependent protease subunit HslV [Candidatus Haliotispira prima]|uniref:ATP-dependent protease subunit HslV n=1 Tax=Candidatus Haliotispira prima TaxID=3034016 RepID=A0ABY8MFD5_9SPIO|nr:ATP-dependent protease subunit HslV [Candidatus Haliotispira prima]
MADMHSTTIVGVKHHGQVAMAGDGQVTFGESIILKGNARKVRRIAGGKALCGFAGSTADAFTLEERFEAKLKEFSDLTRAAVELAREWRMDKALRNLDAMLLCADSQRILLISGRGDVIEPEHDVIAIGSGGAYAFAAARGILSAMGGQSAADGLDAAGIARKALEITADICVFTNQQIVVETI